MSAHVNQTRPRVPTELKVPMSRESKKPNPGMPLARLTQCHHASAHPGQVPSAFGRGRALPVHQSLTVHDMSSFWQARPDTFHTVTSRSPAGWPTGVGPPYSSPGQSDPPRVQRCRCRLFRQRAVSATPSSTSPFTGIKAAVAVHLEPRGRLEQ